MDGRKKAVFGGRRRNGDKGGRRAYPLGAPPQDKLIRVGEKDQIALQFFFCILNIII